MRIFKWFKKDDIVKEENVLNILNKILKLPPFYNPFNEYCTLRSNYRRIDKYVFDTDISAYKLSRLTPVKILAYTEYEFIQNTVDVSIKDYNRYYKNGFYPELKKIIQSTIKHLEKLDKNSLESINSLYLVGVKLLYDMIEGNTMEDADNKSTSLYFIRELVDEIESKTSEKNKNSGQDLRGELEFIKKYKEKRKNNPITEFRKN